MVETKERSDRIYTIVIGIFVLVALVLILLDLRANLEHSLQTPDGVLIIAPPISAPVQTQVVGLEPTFDANWIIDG